MLPLLLVSLLLPAEVWAQTSTIAYPTTAASTATALSSALGYVYAGCYNETTKVPGTDGARALAGNSSANNTMTITSCLSYCATYSQAFAGIEYGRECYCAPYLSAFSSKLADSRCNFACDGNSSELCGGTLALSLYNRTGDSHTGVAWSLVRGDGASWYAFLGVVTLLIALFL